MTLYFLYVIPGNQSQQLGIVLSVSICAQIPRRVSKHVLERAILWALGGKPVVQVSYVIFGNPHVRVIHGEVCDGQRSRRVARPRVAGRDHL